MRMRSEAVSLTPNKKFQNTAAPRPKVWNGSEWVAA